MESCGLHAGVLELLVRLPRVDRLMLRGIADEQHAIAGALSVKEVLHQPGARQTGFIEDD